MIKPPVFEIKMAGSRDGVLSDGVQVGGWGTVEQAMARLGHFKQSGRYRNRKCMCCATVFYSEGPHHRTCHRCRHVGASAETVGV